jgi:hypothetical protein
VRAVIPFHAFARIGRIIAGLSGVGQQNGFPKRKDGEQISLHLAVRAEILPPDAIPKNFSEARGKNLTEKIRFNS